MKRCHVCDLLVVVLCLVLGSASPALAQPPQPGNDQGPRNGQQGQRGPGGPGGFFGGGMLGLVMRPEVQQELQLVDEQKDKLRTLTDDMRNKLRDQMRDLFGQMQNLSPEERRAKFGEIREKFETINADFEKQLNTVLLPQQMDRLKQINLQSQIQQRGASALTSGDVAKALNLTDDQRQKLEQRAADVEKDLQTKIQQLRADARKKMLDVLTPEQQAQLEKMMGPQFDLPEPNFGGGFRGRGFRARTGGRRGGDRQGQGQSRSGNEAI